MNRISELDEAQIRLEVRRLYKEIGFRGLLQVIYETVFFTSVCIEIMKEEYENEKES